jgi:hypothetical protein
LSTNPTKILNIHDLLKNTSKKRSVTAIHYLFLGAGLFYLVVGLHDAFAGRYITGRGLGLLLTLVGAGLMITVPGLLLGTRWSGLLAMAAGGGAASVAVFLAFRSWQDERVISLLFAVGSLGIVVGCVFAAREGVLKGARISIPVIAMATLLFSVTQYFGVQSQPFRTGSVLVLTTSLRELKNRGPFTVFEASVNLRNPTEARIQTVGSLYSVTGVDLVCSVGSPPQRFDRVFSTLNDMSSYARHLQEKPGILVQSGRILEEGVYFEPNEEISRKFIVHARRGTAEVLRATFDVWVANGTQLVLGDLLTGPTAEENADTGFRGVVMRWNLKETSWINDITRGRRLVIASWGRVQSKKQPSRKVTPNLLVYIDREGRRQALSPGTESYNTQLGEFYGLASTRATTEAPMPANPRSRNKGHAGEPRCTDQSHRRVKQ